MWVCSGRWATWWFLKQSLKRPKYFEASCLKEIIHAIFVTASSYIHVHFNMEFILQVVRKSSEQRGTCHVFPASLRLCIQCALT